MSNRWSTYHELVVVFLGVFNQASVVGGVNSLAFPHTDKVAGLCCALSQVLLVGDSWLWLWLRDSLWLLSLSALLLNNRGLTLGGLSAAQSI